MGSGNKHSFIYGNMIKKALFVCVCVCVCVCARARACTKNTNSIGIETLQTHQVQPFKKNSVSPIIC